MSSISNVTGFYSEDNWVTSTEFAMTQPKVHDYTYTGILPAKTEVTFAKVKFNVEDIPGNITTSPDYTVRWLNGENVVFDNFESGTSALWDWSTPESTWHLTEEASYSATHSLTDSPGGDYPDRTENRLMTIPLDFSMYVSASAYFRAKIDIEPDWEYFMLQATTSADAVPGDSLWVTLLELCDYNQPWKLYQVNLDDYAGQSNVRLRVKLDSDAAVNADGVYIDDFNDVGLCSSIHGDEARTEW